MAGTARKIRVVGDPLLHARCRPVSVFDEEIGDLIDDMFASLAIAEGVGLAAPQIGSDLAVFVFDCPDEDGRRHVGHIVNPTIEISGTQVEHEEGCLSVPGPYHELARAEQATVRGVDRAGVALEISGSGFFARCLQHEVDHLNGVLFIDHLPRNRRRRVLRDIEPFEWNARVP
ncbi:MAG: peptide deformylase [Actinomycetota bacterium]|nr:peptide deformylase [Actinomycetota bacterium]